MLPAKYNLEMPLESTGNTGYDYCHNFYHDTSDNCRQILPLVPDVLCLRQTDRKLISL
jgi:hypothetical protein